MHKPYRTPRYGRWSTPSAPLFDATKSPNRASYDGAKAEPGQLSAWEVHIANANAESIRFRKRADKFVRESAKKLTLTGPRLMRRVSQPTNPAIASISATVEPRKDIEPPRKVAVKASYSTRGKRLPESITRAIRSRLNDLPQGSAIQVYAALPAQGTRFYATKVKE